MNCEQCNLPLPPHKNKKARFCNKRCQIKNYTFRNPNHVAKVPGSNSASTGTVSELLVCADLLRKGLSVFRSISPACSCDLVVLKGLELIRVEVKTGFRSASGKHYHNKNPKQVGKHDVLAMVFLKDNSIIYEPKIDGF